MILRIQALSAIGWGLAPPAVLRPFLGADDTGSLPAPAGLLANLLTLGSLIVMVYKLGMWRQEMANTKNTVGADLARYREETNAHFVNLERRFDRIDAAMAAATEHRVASEAWRARAEATAEGQEKELIGLGERLTRIEEVGGSS